MKRLPTDLEILNEIYERYYDVFRDTPDNVGGRKTMTVIDIGKIATALHVDPDIVFGRLYYHLDPKHRYQRDGADVIFFSKDEIPLGRNCINFPYVASVLAELRAEDERHRRTWRISIGALIVSVIAVVVSVITAVWFSSGG